MQGDDRHLRYPRDGAPYLQWYQGRFSNVFIAFHPFFSIPGLRPSECDWGTVVFDNRQTPASSVPPLQELMELAEAERADLISSDDVCALIPARAEAISWAEMCNLTGLGGPQELNQALLTHIRALRPSYESRSKAALVEEACSRKSIFLPTEGAFQVLHRPSLASLFQQVGAQHVTVADAVSDDDYSWATADIAKPWNSWPTRMWTTDQSVLVVVDWDSFFTLVCLSDVAMQTVKIPPFEGFWSTGSTTHDWWLQPTTSAQTN